MTAHFPGLADLKKTFEDTKGLIRRRNSKKDKQHNEKKEKDQLRVITKLPNSEQSYKGKVKTDN
jgi:hypothetical protein